MRWLCQERVEDQAPGGLALPRGVGDDGAHLVGRREFHDAGLSGDQIAQAGAPARDPPSDWRIEPVCGQRVRPPARLRAGLHSRNSHLPSPPRTLAEARQAKRGSRRPTDRGRACVPRDCGPSESSGPSLTRRSLGSHSARSIACSLCIVVRPSPPTPASARARPSRQPFSAGARPPGAWKTPRVRERPASAPSRPARR